MVSPTMVSSTSTATLPTLPTQLAVIKTTLARTTVILNQKTKARTASTKSTTSVKQSRNHKHMYMHNVPNMLSHSVFNEPLTMSSHCYYTQCTQSKTSKFKIAISVLITLTLIYFLRLYLHFTIRTQHIHKTSIAQHQKILFLRITQKHLANFKFKTKLVIPRFFSPTTRVIPAPAPQIMLEAPALQLSNTLDVPALHLLDMPALRRPMLNTPVTTLLIVPAPVPTMLDSPVSLIYLICRDYMTL